MTKEKKLKLRYQGQFGLEEKFFDCIKGKSTLKH